MHQPTRSVRRLAIALLALVLIVAGCSSSDGSDDETTTTTTPGATTTTAGQSTTTTLPDTGPEGTLKIGLTTDVGGFDPFSRAATQWPIVQNIYDTLVRYTPDQEAVPGLMASWEFADDGTSMTMTLQPDATWHSGADVTADDIVANFDRAMTEATGAHMFTATDPVSSVTAVDDDTILIEFDGPFPSRAATDMLQQLAMIEPSFFNNLDNQASGSGPYKLGSWDPGIQLTLVANEDYWGDGPFLETLEFTVFSDSDALVAALQAGNTIQLASDIPGKDAASLVGPYDVFPGAPGSLVLDLRINTMAPPFDNKVVRQALGWHAVDRQGIVDAILYGLSVPSLTVFDAGPFLDISFGTSKEFNLDVAQAHLDSAGIDLTGVEIEMLVDTRFDDVQAIAEVLKSDWEKLGLVVTLVPGDDVFDRYLAGDFAAYPSITSNGNKYPLAAFSGSIYRSEANPAFGPGTPPQEWLDIRADLQTALTPEAQEAAAAHLIDYYVDEAWALTVADRPTLFAVSTGVLGFEFTVDSMPVYQYVRLAG